MKYLDINRENLSILSFNHIGWTSIIYDSSTRMSVDRLN